MLKLVGVVVLAIALLGALGAREVKASAEFPETVQEYRDACSSSPSVKFLVCMGLVTGVMSIMTATGVLYPHPGGPIGPSLMPGRSIYYEWSIR
jgi:hypothetical protein